MNDNQKHGEPSNIEAEQALLGALLNDNRLYRGVCDALEPEAFVDPVHRDIYRAISRRIEQGQVANPATVREDFERSGEMDEVGGNPYSAS